MSKKVLIIKSSLRKNGNSNKLAESFAKGAVEAGNEVDIISLAENKIGFCRGCLVCQKTQKCVIKDDAIEIAEKMKNADVIVFATPVYYYSVCGQLKTMLDRANPLYSSDYIFRDIYLLATAAEEDTAAVDGTVTAIKGWTSCFEKAKLIKTIFAGGVNGEGEIEGHSALKDAYDSGRTVI